MVRAPAPLKRDVPALPRTILETCPSGEDMSWSLRGSLRGPLAVPVRQRSTCTHASPAALGRRRRPWARRTKRRVGLPLSDGHQRPAAPAGGRLDEEEKL